MLLFVCRLWMQLGDFCIKVFDDFYNNIFYMSLLVNTLLHFKINFIHIIICIQFILKSKINTIPIDKIMVNWNLNFRFGPKNSTFFLLGVLICLISNCPHLGLGDVAHIICHHRIDDFKLENRLQNHYITLVQTHFQTIELFIGKVMVVTENYNVGYPVLWISIILLGIFSLLT